MTLPSLYAILDAESCVRRGLALEAVAEAWRDAGIRLVQYRDKQGSDAEVLRHAAMLRDVFSGTGTTLILNDRVHLFARSGFYGLHVGQTDTAIEEARAVIGQAAILGISTHNPEQLRHADALAVDYVAVGPVFTTGTKLDAAPVVGLEGLRTARSLTKKPLVAIGGITRSAVPAVLGAGADSIAVISALLSGNQSESTLTESAQDFLAAFK